jgi:hypothetical protein
MVSRGWLVTSTEESFGPVSTIGCHHDDRELLVHHAGEAHDWRHRAMTTSRNVHRTCRPSLHGITSGSGVTAVAAGGAAATPAGAANPVSEPPVSDGLRSGQEPKPGPVPLKDNALLLAARYNRLDLRPHRPHLPWAV